MKPLLAIAWLLAVGGLLTEARAEPQAQVRTSIAQQDADTIWVGQRVTLIVELLAPGMFASAPAFDLPQLPGVVIVPPASSPVLGTETINDAEFTTQRHELAVYTQHAGTNGIPAFVVRFSARPELGQPEVDYVIKTMPVEFVAKLPPGAKGLSMVMTTSDLKADQTWNPLPGASSVPLGSAFTRTITVEADGIPAMVLPAFSAHAPKGLTAYAKPPLLEDHTDRGVLRGRRVDSVTFVCESPGDFTIPTLSFAWWDPDSQKLNHVELSGQTIHVLALPSAVSESASAAPPSYTWVLWALGGGVIAGFATLMCSAWWKQRQGSAPDLEATRFQAFQHACHQGNPRSILSAYFAWLDVAVEQATDLTSSELTNATGVLGLEQEIATLEADVYGRAKAAPHWSSDRLLQEAQAARQRLQRLPEHAIQNNKSKLQPLNPC